MKEVKSEKKSTDNFSSAKGNLSSNTKWLLYPYISYGKVTLFARKNDSEHFNFLWKIPAMLTNGARLSETETNNDPINILWMTPETQWEHVLLNFVINKGDTKRFFFMYNFVKQLDDERICEVIKLADIKLLVINPFMYFVLKSAAASSKNIEYYINYLKKIAKETGCAIVLWESGYGYGNPDSDNRIQRLEL